VQNQKVRKQPIHLGSLEIAVWDVHQSHLPQHHHSLRVKFLRNVQLRRQPKNLSKLSKLHIESLAIGHPHKDHLFLIKEESGVELSNDLLVPVVPELQQICNSMEGTSLYNPVEVHILLVLHVIYMHKLMLDHRRDLRVEHSSVPVLMKESPEPLISPSLL
jgi:hypothetical protein